MSCKPRARVRAGSPAPAPRPRGARSCRARAASAGRAGTSIDLHPADPAPPARSSAESRARAGRRVRWPRRRSSSGTNAAPSAKPGASSRIARRASRVLPDAARPDDARAAGSRPGRAARRSAAARPRGRRSRRRAPGAGGADRVGGDGAAAERVVQRLQLGAGREPEFLARAGRRTRGTPAARARPGPLRASHARCMRAARPRRAGRPRAAAPTGRCPRRGRCRRPGARGRRARQAVRRRSRSKPSQLGPRARSRRRRSRRAVRRAASGSASAMRRSRSAASNADTSVVDFEAKRAALQLDPRRPGHRLQAEQGLAQVRVGELGLLLRATASPPARRAPTHARLSARNASSWLRRSKGRAKDSPPSLDRRRAEEAQTNRHRRTRGRGSTSASPCRATPGRARPRPRHGDRGTLVQRPRAQSSLAVPRRPCPQGPTHPTWSIP